MFDEIELEFLPERSRRFRPRADQQVDKALEPREFRAKAANAGPARSV